MPEPTYRNAIDDEDLEPEVTMEIGFSKIIVVDNIPVVPQEKYEKLRNVITKIFSTIGDIKDLYMPQDEKQVTRGYAFIEFKTAEMAESAIAKTDGYKLDKSHIFRVNSYEDFQKYAAVPDKYVAPQPKPYEPRENLKSWLMHPGAMDQYCIRYADMVEILWNDLTPGKEPEVVAKRVKWTDTYCAWSPLGTYLLTIHTNKGVAIWGGEKWDKLMRFPHPGVKLVDFSPCEKYLVTASPQFQENDNPKDPQCIIVWNVRTGEKMRGFLGGKETSWPVFKWSYDDKYLARFGDEAIAIYETPSMNLLDKKSVKIPGIKDFCWSPTDNIISYFVPEGNNKPATVVLMDIPSKRERRQKNLFSVADCKMHWHPGGDYLCVKVDRTTKTKKSTYSNFELFRIREKDIPIEQLEIKDQIIAFAWEPKGNKFAVIHGEGPRPDVSFYAMENKVKHLKTLEKRAANHLFWSPQGDFIVLAGLHNLNGALEFYNAAEMESMGSEEHFMCTNVEWDPTGRYVTTVVSYWRHQLENGYNLYSFQGKPLRHVLKDKFYQLLWRPRPPSLLPKERQEYIKKNINQYAQAFKKYDAEILAKQEAALQAQREVLRKNFEQYLQVKEKQYQQQADARRELRGGEESENEDDFQYREEWVEDVEEYKEIVLED